MKVLLFCIVGIAIIAAIPPVMVRMVANPDARELIFHGFAMLLAGCVVSGFTSKR